MKCKRPFSKGGRLTKNVYNFMSRRARAGSSSSLSLYQEQLKALAHLETDILQLNEMTIKSVISSILASNMIIDNAKIYSIFKLLHVAVQIRPNIIEYIADIFLQFHQRHIDIETFLKMILHFPSFKFFLYQLYKRGVITIEYIIQNLDNDSDLFLYFAPEIEENDPLFFSQHMYLITKSNVCIYNPETHFSRRELGINDSDIAISLRNDDVETLKSILYQANITFVEPSFFERCGYINHVVTLIDYSAYFSAINCFNFLRSQNFEITNSTLNFAIAGGNNDIINICKESLQSVNASTFITAIQFHRNLFLKQIIDFSHIQTDINFLTCSINSNNTTAFLNFLKTDINKLNDEGMTALHCSVHSRNLLYIQALCSTPNIKINQKDINGMTPLHLSASLGYFEIVFYFTFQNRIHINETDNNGYTALHMASKGGFTQIVSLLTSTENIEIDKRNINGETPLHVAAMEGNLDIVKHFCAIHGVDVNARDKFGTTPLLAAMVFNQQNVVEYLCDHPYVDVNAVNNAGQNIIFYAILYSSFEFVRFLVSLNRIEVNRPNAEGRTPYQIAALLKNRALMDLLKPFQSREVSESE